MNLNTQANALSRLQSLGPTTVALSGDIPTYSDDATLTQKQADLASESDVSDYLLIVHGDLQDPPLVLIAIGKMVQAQQADHFCSALVARLQKGKNMSFSQNKDCILFRLSEGVA